VDPFSESETLYMSDCEWELNSYAVDSPEKYVNLAGVLNLDFTRLSIKDGPTGSIRNQLDKYNSGAISHDELAEWSKASVRLFLDTFTITMYPGWRQVD
jgi:hypothetical protein